MTLTPPDVVFPFEQLPTEIKILCFINCLGEDTERPLDYGGMDEDPPHHLAMKATDAPVLLTQVCRSWREIAIQTPQLWTSLLLFRTRRAPEDPLAKTAYDECLLGLLSMWIQRSGRMPLSFRWNDVFMCYGSPYHSEDDKLMLQILRPAMQRVKFLYLYGPVLRASNLLSAHGDDLQTLQILSLCFTPRTGNIGNELTNQGLSIHAPRLRALHLLTDIFHREVNLPLFDMPWAQLTTLSLDTWSTIAETLHALSQCRALVRLDVYIGQNMRDVGVLQTPLTMTCLTRLKIHIKLALGLDTYRDTYPRVAVFLNALTLPALKTLRCPTADPGRNAAVASLLGRSQCALESLEICAQEGQHDASTLCLITSISTLRFLKISTSESSPTFGSSRQGESIFKRELLPVGVLPNLEELTMEVFGLTFGYDAVEVFAWIESRRVNGTRLRVVDVPVLMEAYPDAEEVVDRYTSQGMVLSIRQPFFN